MKLEGSVSETKLIGGVSKFGNQPPGTSAGGAAACAPSLQKETPQMDTPKPPGSDPLKPDVPKLDTSKPQPPLQGELRHDVLVTGISKTGPPPPPLKPDVAKMDTPQPIPLEIQKDVLQIEISKTTLIGGLKMEVPRMDKRKRKKKKKRKPPPMRVELTTSVKLFLPKKEKPKTDDGPHFKWKWPGYKSGTEIGYGPESNDPEKEKKREVRLIGGEGYFRRVGDEDNNLQLGGGEFGLTAQKTDEGGKVELGGDIAAIKGTGTQELFPGVKTGEEIKLLDAEAKAAVELKDGKASGEVGGGVYIGKAKVSGSWTSPPVNLPILGTKVIKISEEMEAGAGAAAKWSGGIGRGGVKWHSTLGLGLIGGAGGGIEFEDLPAKGGER